ncbi:hypothetical protein BpHYR1_030944 [Brachionus plicatilis]|uniref:Uncharacterized protein n=1 Tax=Brachionus plicatilis TaxID=10195 RepID=A0A3M7SVR6_BRAPC|nr:hypothetical protein BpHYR1_030944 [Brachionus plicatilis]
MGRLQRAALSGRILLVNNLVLLQQPNHAHIVRTIAALVKSVAKLVLQQMLLERAVIAGLVRTTLAQKQLSFFAKRHSICAILTAIKHAHIGHHVSGGELLSVIASQHHRLLAHFFLVLKALHTVVILLVIVVYLAMGVRVRVRVRVLPAHKLGLCAALTPFDQDLYSFVRAATSRKHFDHSSAHLSAQMTGQYVFFARVLPFALKSARTALVHHVLSDVVGKKMVGQVFFDAGATLVLEGTVGTAEVVVFDGG